MDKFLIYTKLVLYVIAAFFVVFLLIVGLEDDLMPYNYWAVLAINVYMVFASRKNMMLFIVMGILLYSNYSFIFANYIHWFDFTLYTQVISPKVTTVSVNITTLFTCLLLFMVPFDKVKPLPATNIFIKEEKFDQRVCLILLFMMVVVFIVGFDAPTIEGRRGRVKPIYEYALSFFIVYFYYCGNAKKWLYTGVVFAVLYAGQNFIFGGRIYGLQFLLCTFVMVFMHKISMKQLMIGMSVLFVLFSVIGVVRGALLSSNVNVGEILNRLANHGFALDTAYSAYYTSETFVYIDDIYSRSEKLDYFKDFIISIFLGNSYNPSAFLANVSKQYLHNSAGGMMPYFFFFYLGHWGIIIPALMLKFYLSKIINLYKKNTGYIKCISVFVVTHTFRWYLYTPLGLLRGVLFLSIVYYGMYIVHNYRRKPY